MNIESTEPYEKPLRKETLIASKREYSELTLLQILVHIAIINLKGGRALRTNTKTSERVHPSSS